MPKTEADMIREMTDAQLQAALTFMREHVRILEKEQAFRDSLPDDFPFGDGVPEDT